MRYTRFSGRAFCGAALLAVGSICLPSTGQGATHSREHLIDVLGVEKGLRSSSVTTIAQTPDGYLWVGTYNGLARFDGEQFTTFAPDDTPELKHARVRRLFADRAGTLWISTYDGSVTSYRAGHFTLEWVGRGNADSAATAVTTQSTPPIFLLNTGALIRRSGPVTNGVPTWETIQPPGMSSGQLAVEDRQGRIWTRSRDQKLWRFDGKEFTAVPTNGLTGAQITVLTADPFGRIWIGTDHEFAVWDGRQFVSMNPTNGESSLYVSALLVTDDGSVWTVANARVRKANDRVWVAESDACRDLFQGFMDRLGMHEDALGSVWLYHYGKGLFQIEPDGQTHEFGLHDLFPGRRVDCFFEDREGNIWAGVDRGGLIRLREKLFKVLAPGDVTANAAVTVAEDHEGGIWIGTYGSGLYRWFNEHWTSTFLSTGLQRGYVFSVRPDAAGRIWASAGEEDLFVSQGGEFAPNSPNIHGVKAILPARDGRVWIGLKSGLAYLAGRTYRLYQAEDGVRRIEIRALAEDERGDIWAGAGDGTLYQVSSNHVQSFTPADDRVPHAIVSLLPDTNGVMWVGTFRGGLLRFAAGKFARVTQRQGLPDNVICQLLDDEAGNLWIGSQQGVFRIAKSKVNAVADGRQPSARCKAYGLYDGLPSLECSANYQPAAWRTRDGRLLFATSKGVAMVEPSSTTTDPLPPPVVIEDVLVDGQPQPPPTSDLRSPASALLTVPPGKKQVEFRYAGVSLVSPDRVRFRYRLAPLDKDWTEAGVRRTAQYSYLKPGDYSFQVIACNNDGGWTPVAAAMRVTILPHFYERGWFLTLAVVVATAGVAGLARHVSVRRLRKRLEHLEQQQAIERDRARIAKDIHDDLGAGLTHIALLSDLARPGVSAELQPQLGQISEVARELTSHMDEIVWAISPENDSLDGLMTYVCKFAQDYLSAAGIRCRLDVPAQLPALQLGAEVRHNLFLAVKEVINNVVQHARATETWVRLKIEPHSFTLSIEDNGRGLPAPGGPDESARPGRVQTGHGRQNIEKRLAQSGGRCVLTSEPGKGTHVALTVLLKDVSPELASSGNGQPH